MKFKFPCQIFGEATVRNLLILHGWAATILGWGYFIVGNIYHFNHSDFATILEFNVPAVYFAMWASTFILAVYVLVQVDKRRKKVK